MCGASHFFFFNDTATTEIYTLSLHDALPISRALRAPLLLPAALAQAVEEEREGMKRSGRSEEHTSELQSLAYLVCRLLLEKKNVGSSSDRSSASGERTAPLSVRSGLSRDPLP